MTEQSYSKREQDHYYGDLFKRMDKQDSTLERIEVQTTATNGRVSKLEWWKTAFVWALGAAWTLILILVPVFLYFARSEAQRISEETSKQVLADMENSYEIVIKNNK